MIKLVRKSSGAGRALARSNSETLGEVVCRASSFLLVGSFSFLVGVMDEIMVVVEEAAFSDWTSSSLAAFPFLCLRRRFMMDCLADTTKAVIEKSRESIESVL